LKSKFTESDLHNNPNPKMSSAYEGFVTIPIQKLNSKPHPKGAVSGTHIWGKYPVKNILYYE
jgi:hypothetical protein